jgi:Ankyrin repeats (many copies)
MSYLCHCFRRGEPGTLELKAHWFHAMQRGDIALVERLWAYKPQELKSVRFPAHHDDDSITPLQFAVTLGNAPLLQALFSLRRINKQGQSVAAFRVNAKTYAKQTTALHKAAHYCNLPLLQACLQHGANPLIPSDKSCFPHHLCAMRACDRENNRDMNRHDAFMAIARVLLKGCNDEQLQSHPEAVVLDDWLELREYRYYTDAAKAFLQEALQLNAHESAAAAAAAAVAPVAADAAAAAVAAAAADAAAAAVAAAAAAPNVLQPAVAVPALVAVAPITAADTEAVAAATLLPSALVPCTPSAAASSVHAAADRGYMTAAGTTTAAASTAGASTAAALQTVSAAGTASSCEFDTWLTSSAIGGSSSSGRASYAELLNDAGGPAQLIDHTTTAHFSVNSSMQHSTCYSSQYNAASTAAARNMSSTAAVAAPSGS